MAGQRRYEQNQQVGQWTLLEYFPSRRPDRPKARWRSICSCGAVRLVAADNLQNGSSTSCGHGTKANKPALNIRRVSSVFDLGRPA